MSQYMPEEIETEVRRAAISADDIETENIRNAQLQTERMDAARLEENREADNHAAEYMGEDVDEYPNQQIEPRTQIEQYMELGLDQNPADAINQANDEDKRVADNNAVTDNAFAESEARAAAADATAANNQAMQNAMIAEQIRPAPSSLEVSSEIAQLLYRNGGFINGAVGGVAPPPSTAPSQSGQADTEPAVEPVDPPSSTLEVEPQEAGNVQSEDALDEFQRHLQQQSKRNKK